MNPLAYHHHTATIGTWIAEIVARSMVYRTVAVLTRGMSPILLIGLTVLAVGILWAISRR